MNLEAAFKTVSIETPRTTPPFRDRARARGRAHPVAAEMDVRQVFVHLLSPAAILSVRSVTGFRSLACIAVPVAGRMRLISERAPCGGMRNFAIHCRAHLSGLSQNDDTATGIYASLNNTSVPIGFCAGGRDRGVSFMATPLSPYFDC